MTDSSTEVVPPEAAPANNTYEINVFFEFVVPGVLLNGIGLLGLLGNVLSIIVLSRPQMKSSINCILIGLASYDTILILTSILMFGLPAVHTYSQDWFGHYFYDVFPFITPVVYPIGMIAQTGSVYLTICVTIERYVAVCLPLKARYLCTFGRAKIYVACIGLIALIYNIPRFWEVTWQTTYYDDLEANITDVISTELREDPTYINVYITWLYLVVMYIVPFTCLAVFNLLIYHEVRRANSARASLTRLQQKEIGLATMLMVVVVVFFVCNILALVVNILEVLGINIIALNNTSNLLVTFNSSVNLIIYCIFGGKFKRIFLQIFCPGCVEDRQFVTRYPHSAHPGNAAAVAAATSAKSATKNATASKSRRSRPNGIEDTYDDDDDDDDDEAAERASLCLQRNDRHRFWNNDGSGGNGPSKPEENIPLGRWRGSKSNGATQKCCQAQMTTACVASESPYEESPSQRLNRQQLTRPPISKRMQQQPRSERDITVSVSICSPPKKHVEEDEVEKKKVDAIEAVSKEEDRSLYPPADGSSSHGSHSSFPFIDSNQSF